MKKIVIGVLVIGGLIALAVWLVARYGSAKKKADYIAAGGNDVRTADALQDDGPTGTDKPAVGSFYSELLGTQIEVVG